MIAFSSKDFSQVKSEVEVSVPARLRHAGALNAETLAPQHPHVVTCRENYAAVRWEMRAARAAPPCLRGVGT